MSRQQLVMLEASEEKFKINSKYYDAMPRPTYDESRALDLKLIEKGQLEPIIVNPKMVILDGHSRFELLQARGKMIKYIIRKFENDEAELEYVIETNVMRRQLNNFQRIETMYGLYKQRQIELKMKDYTFQLTLLASIKNGAITSNEMAEITPYVKYSINSILRELVKDYCVSRERKWEPYPKGKGRGANVFYTYKILPKGEERLAKEKIRTIGSASVLVGKIVGLNRNIVNMGIVLLEKAKPEMLIMLREGKIVISAAYSETTSIGVRVKRKHYIKWGPYDRIICPLCKQTSHKEDFMVIKSNVRAKTQNV